MLVLFLTMVFSTGCIFFDSVGANEVGVVVDAGQYKRVDNSFIFMSAPLEGRLKISRTTQTITVEDKSVATKDTQLVEVKVVVQCQRKADEESIRNLVTNWSNIAFDDKQLNTVISGIAAQGIKTGTRTYTLQQLLDDRDGLANAIKEGLKSETDKFSVTCVAVIVSNIDPNPEYIKLLNDKANLQAQQDLEIKRQDLIKQQGLNEQLKRQADTAVLNEELKKQQAQTAVDVEIAAREGKKTAASNQVYVDNPQAFALKQLELFREIMGDKATVYFIPEGTNVYAFLNGMYNTMPITTTKGIK